MSQSVGIINRITSPTPVFFQKVFKYGGYAALIAGTILSLPALGITLPTAIITAAKFVTTIGATMAALSKTAKEDFHGYDINNMTYQDMLDFCKAYKVKIMATDKIEDIREKVESFISQNKAIPINVDMEPVNDTKLSYTKGNDPNMIEAINNAPIELDFSSLDLNKMSIQDLKELASKLGIDLTNTPTELIMLCIDNFIKNLKPAK